MLKNYKKRDFASLKEEEKEEKIVFHLLSDFIQGETLEKLKSLEKNLNIIYPTTIQTHILSDDVFSNCRKLGSSYVAYFRICIAKLLDNVDTTLYLDVDMLVCDDIRALWTLDLHQKTAAVLGDWGFATKRQRKSLFGKEDFVFDDFYFNSGFILMNLKAFREKNIVEECVYFLNHYDALFHDQDALNYAIREKDILVVPLPFNAFVAANLGLENPVILHFAGIVKPWENPFVLQNEKGEYIGLRYIEAAEKSFCFADDIEKNLILYAQKIYLSRIVFQYSKSIFGLLKIPFVITKTKIRDFQKEEALDYLKNYDNDCLFSDFSENGKDHLIKEFYAKYARAKKDKSLLYLLKLPLAILKVKIAAQNKQ